MTEVGLLKGGRQVEIVVIAGNVLLCYIYFKYYYDFSLTGNVEMLPENNAYPFIPVFV